MIPPLDLQLKTVTEQLALVQKRRIELEEKMPTLEGLALHNARNALLREEIRVRLLSRRLEELNSAKRTPPSDEEV